MLLRDKKKKKTKINKFRQPVACCCRDKFLLPDFKILLFVCCNFLKYERELVKKNVFLRIT